MCARRRRLLHLLRSDRAATTAEYGILIVLVGALALMTLLLLEQPMRDLYAAMDGTVEEATGGWGKGSRDGNSSGSSSCGSPPCGNGPGGRGSPDRR